VLFLHSLVQRCIPVVFIMLCSFYIVLYGNVFMLLHCVVRIYIVVLFLHSLVQKYIPFVLIVLYI
jgi:hypothetical protein